MPYSSKILNYLLLSVNRYPYNYYLLFYEFIFPQLRLLCKYAILTFLYSKRYCEFFIGTVNERCVKYCIYRLHYHIIIIVFVF